MVSFKAVSYLQGIWNAICSVDHKTRRWDVYDLDEFIIKKVADGVPMIIEGLSEENPWYSELKELWVLAKELSVFGEDDCSPEVLEEFKRLLYKNFDHLWF